MKMRPTRLLVWVVIAAVVALLVLALRPQPIEADFTKVLRGPLQITLDEEGKTRVRDRYMVSAPVAGRVLRIEHEPGDSVDAGRTVLARFYPSAPQLLDNRARAIAEGRVKAAEATLEKQRVELLRAQAEQRHARVEFERSEKMHADGLLATNQMDSVKLQVETTTELVHAAKTGIKLAQRELETAQASLIQSGSASNSENSIILLRSPINGVILRRLQESEAVIQSGEPLVEVADPDKLEIVSDMLSTDAVQINPGDQVLIEQWGGEKTLQGRVRRIEPYGFTKISALGVEEQRVNVIVDFEDVQQAWEALGDGYRVEVRIVIWESNNVLKVPTSSLFRNGEQWAVYQPDAEGLVVLQEVKIGQRNAREAQVVEGLQEGATVLAYPSDKITEGIMVVERTL